MKDARTVAYAVGETIELCLALELTPARGIRRIVAVLSNERGEIIELTDVPARVSECVLQDPSQTALRGRAVHPGAYKLRSMKVKDLQGVTYLDPPEVNLEVKDKSDTVPRCPA
jgi:hypothetical protein